MKPPNEPSPPLSVTLVPVTRRGVLKSAATVGAVLAADPRFMFAAAESPQAAAISRDLLVRNFQTPPKDYRPVDNWWWEAGRLTKEKLTWQLEEFKAKGINGVWYYVRWVYGEPLSSSPAFWTEEWWDFVRFTLQELKRLGLEAWFSVWEVNGFIQKRLLAEAEHHPEYRGRNLVIYREESKGAGPIKLALAPHDEIVDAAAYRKVGKTIDYSSRITLTKAVRDHKLEWRAPDADWLLTAIVAQPDGLDYFNPAMTRRWNEMFLGEYEKRLSEYMGTVLKAFGVDEHSILHGNTLFSPTLLAKVQRERGYDLTPHLIGLFYDIGAKTDQIRGDYYNAMSALIEENFSKPTAQWLESRGMEYVTASTHDEGQPLAQTYVYGDVVRYMRSFHSVGGEDPSRTVVGERNLYNAKFASSIAHLYERKRAIVMAYFFTGWGVTQAQNVAWTNENYAYGINFYDRHGVLYSVLGGWYEYAPPEDHFYQPHWRYWKTFSDYVSRLSYIMGQGKHRADVALFFPVTTIHANWVAGRHKGNSWEGDLWEAFDKPAIETGERTKDLARALVHDGIDLDVMDDESLGRATVKGAILEVAGVELRAIVLPPLTTIRTGSMQKIQEFYNHGGTVVSLGRLPHASVEKGRGDPALYSAIEAIFGVKPDEKVSRTMSRTNAQGGKSYFVPRDVAEIPKIISGAIERDVVASEKDVYHTHQKVGEQDVYFVFNAQDKDRELSIRFRLDGEPERWDAFSGDIHPVYCVKRDGQTTEVKLAMQPYEAAVVVFSPGNVRPAVLEANLSNITNVTIGETLILQGFDEAAGKKRARIRHQGQEYLGETEAKAPPAPVELTGPFEFHLEPTMDNRWGDYRYPAAPQMIGAEARRFRYFEEGDKAGTELGWHRPDFKDSEWPEVTYSYGPYWWHIGPFRKGGDTEPRQLLDDAKRGRVDVNVPWPRLKSAESDLHWEPYVFSKKFGPAYFDKAMGSIGMDGMSNNFLTFGPGPTSKHYAHYLFTQVYSPNEADYTFYYGVESPKTPISGFEKPPLPIPARTQAWLNGEEILWVTAQEESEIRQTVRLRQGWNSVLLRVIQLGTTGAYAVFLPGEPPANDPYVPLLRWFKEPQPLVYDITPNKSKRIGWYRFKAPPGTRSMRLKMQAREVTAWVDGRSVPVRDGVISLTTSQPTVSQVVLRVVQESGTYGGAVFQEPVEFTCEAGRIPLGDWSQFGLATYSGIGVYGKEITLTKQQLVGKVILELGEANTVAELLVNGQQAGVRMMRPYRFDITSLVKEGSNRLEIKVANTLANHMSTYPTAFVFEGQTLSGLLGPVRIRFVAPVSLTATVSARA